MDKYKRVFCFFQVVMIFISVTSITAENEIVPLYKVKEAFPIEPSTTPEDSWHYYRPPTVVHSTDKIRTAAEFEPSQAVVLSWDPSHEIWGFDDLHVFLVKQALMANVDIIIECFSEGVYPDVIEILTNNGISSSDINNHVHFIQNENYMFLWSRDPHAQTIYYGDDNQIGIVDWQYYGVGDYMPAQVGRVEIIDCNNYSAEEYYPEWQLNADGGNFLTDGFFTSFWSKRVEIDNELIGGIERVETIMENYHGINKTIILDLLGIYPDNFTEHMDMYMKFLDEETLLVGRLPGNPVNDIIESNIQEVQSQATSVWGRPYKIVRIDFPEPEIVTVIDPNVGPIDLPTFYTYTNSLILNNRVLVPTFNKPEDAAALSIYESVMSDYTIVSYDCSGIIPLGGAIHCITHEINRANPVITTNGIPTDATIQAGAYDYFERFVSKGSITTEAGVSIEPGGFVIAKTDGTIYLEPGFTAKNGSFFRAHITN